MAMARSLILLVFSVLLVFLPASSAKKQATCDAIQQMAEAIEVTLGYSYTCNTNSDCDAVTCRAQSSSNKFKVEILQCDDPPGVKISSTDGGDSESVTFHHSSTKTYSGGSITAVLKWDSGREILGVSLSITDDGQVIQIVPYSEIPIDDSGCPNWALILGISVPVAVILVAALCCGLPLGICCCMRRRRRRLNRFQVLSEAVEDAKL